MRRSGGDADFESPVPLVLGLLALPMGAFGSMILHYSGQGPSPSAVVGCYAATEAGATLSLDGQRIRFGQIGIAPIAYDLSMARLGGLAIAPRSNVQLMREQAGYHFRPARSMTVSLFPLVRLVNGRTRSVRRPDEMEAIAVTASDGRLLLFGRASPERCCPDARRR